jgi:tetratricopeptide (TPR) repeat protein
VKSDSGEKKHRKTSSVSEITEQQKLSPTWESVLRQWTDSTVIHCIVIVFIAILAYSNTFDGPFQFDEKVLIRENPIIKNLDYFLSPSDAEEHAEYGIFRRRYVSFLTFALNYSIHGLDVRGFHILNITIHILNALLVYAFVILTFKTPYFDGSQIKKSSKFIALSSGLLFVSHPVQTEAVTYIMQRFASLSAFFYLASMVFYVKWKLTKEQHLGGAALIYFFALLSTALAFNTKENSLTLPFAMVLYEFFFFKGIVRKRVLPLIPLFLLLIIIPFNMAMTGMPVESVLLGVKSEMADNVSGSVFDKDYLNSSASRLEYFITQFNVITIYMRLLLLPVGQNLDYDIPLLKSIFDARALIPMLLLIFIFSFAVYCYWRSRAGKPGLRLVSWGILWFFLTLSVESSIIPIPMRIAEYRAYMPSMGIFLCIVSGGITLMQGIDSKRDRDVLTAFFLLLPMVFMAATHARNNIWRSEISLWEDVIKKSPKKARGYVNLGKAYADEGFTDNAIEHYQTAIRLNPDFKEAHINIGTLYIGIGMYDKAAEHFQFVLRIDPGFPEAYNNLGNAYQSMGRFDEAIDNYLQELRFNPRSIKARYNLGIVYMKKGMLDEAIDQYKAVIEMKQEFIDAHYRLGSAYMSKGMVDKAIEHYEAVVSPRSDMFSLLPIKHYQTEAHYNLGSAYESKGFTDMAIEHYTSAIKQDPYNITAYNNLGVVYMSKGMTDKAIEYFKTVFRLAPDHANTYFNLGEAHFSKGNIDKAIKHYSEFLNRRPDYAEAHLNIGVAYEAKGLSGKAKKHYKQALALNPGLEEAQENLQMLTRKKQ